MGTTLKNITINSFKGISENSPVIIDFNGEDNIIKFDGDQGKGKSSTLDGILWLMGASFDVNIKELFNGKNPIEEEMVFEHNEVKYKVIAKGDKIVVKSCRESDGTTSDKYVNEASPKDLLNRIFKKCIVRQDFRYDKPEKQVEWVSELFPMPKDEKQVIIELTKKIEVLKKETRPSIGRMVTQFKTLTESNPLYLEYKERGELLEKEILMLKKKDDKNDIEKITKEYNKFVQASSTLSSLKEIEKPKIENEISDIEKQIKELESRLGLKKEELILIDDRINKGEEFIEKNKSIEKKYSDSMALVTSANENAIRIQNFESLKANFAEWNKFESDYATIDSQIKEVVKTIKEIKAEYIPKIEGVEIVTDVEMEDGEIVGNDVGIYFNDVNLRTLSGSEYIITMIKIIRKSGSRFIFIDDLATYGSETVSYINELAKSIKDEGGVIFCSEMDRGTELRIEMTDSI
jgi:DNA repair ATPase RecN